MAEYSDRAGDPQRTVLIVDDEENLREVLTQVVGKPGYRVLTAANGLAAKEILAKESVDVIVSDIRMPEMDGIALTGFVKSTTKIPVILMTGFAEILETKDAFELGADEFLAKPFNQDELLTAIRRCLAKTLSADEPIEDYEFCRLSINDFISGRQIKFNIFIRLSDTKFIKIAHEGQDLPVERIRAFRDKNVHYLYLRAKDFRQYVGFGVSLMKKARDSKTISQGTKLNLMKHTGEIMLERIRHDGIDEDVYTQATSFVESTVSVLGEEDEITDVLTLLNEHADYVYAHSVGVSVYGVMLARAVGWELPANLFKVSMGGLLHDVGEKEIDKLQLLKPRGRWSHEELRKYETHSVRGAEILSEMKYISTDVIVVIMQHHENSLGMGFPSRLKRTAIHPMSKLITVADEFCSRIVRTPSNPGMSPLEAVEQMTALCSDRLEPSFFTALKQLCKFTPPPNKGAMHGRTG